ncbi:MAG: orotidine-5'-phosphate decarboxylase [Bacillota bacterium]|nr:orotidine-5'-phosphate decarboxylase [Bacillota bacterium]
MKDVIIACDFASREELNKFLEAFGEERPYVKVGMQLFYAEGAPLIKELKARGHKLFLDLKLYDIPNTVASAIKVLGGLGVDMINVHAAGGSEMMKAAKEAVQGFAQKPLLIAVTQLTSTSEELMKRELLIEKSLDEVVLAYAKNARDCGLDGVVCSAMEAKKIHEHIGEDFCTVTPGIRFAGGTADDQVRVMTPEQAKKEGADFIVVGRAITGAEHPLEAYQKCLAEFLG